MPERICISWKSRGKQKETKYNWQNSLPAVLPNGLCLSWFSIIPPPLTSQQKNGNWGGGGGGGMRLRWLGWLGRLPGSTCAPQKGKTSGVHSCRKLRFHTERTCPEDKQDGFWSDVALHGSKSPNEFYRVTFPSHTETTWCHFTGSSAELPYHALYVAVQRRTQWEQSGRWEVIYKNRMLVRLPNKWVRNATLWELTGLKFYPPKKTGEEEKTFLVFLE